MKRTNLVLDEEQLHEAVRLGGHRTYSDAVNQALAEYIRLKNLSGIYDYAGKRIWHGNLSKMRDRKNVLG